MSGWEAWGSSGSMVAAAADYTAAQRRAAVRTVAANARDAADLLLLCEALDLDPREARGTP